GPNRVDIDKGRPTFPFPQMGLCTHQIDFGQTHQDKVHAAVVVPIGRGMAELVFRYPVAIAVQPALVGEVHGERMAHIVYILIGAVALGLYDWIDPIATVTGHEATTSVLSGAPDRTPDDPPIDLEVISRNTIEMVFIIGRV